MAKRDSGTDRRIESFRFPGIFGDRVRVRHYVGKDRSESEGPYMAIARTHLAEIDRKIADLSALRTKLDRVIGSCSHGNVADCKIIETLAPRAHG